MEWLYLIIGSVLGAGAQLLLEHPFEELAEKRFQQILHTGIYRRMYFQTVSYANLKKSLAKAIKEYDFDTAMNCLKRMEWFVEEKTREEKITARKEAGKDYSKDLKIIAKFKGNSNRNKYQESANKWEKNGHKKVRPGTDKENRKGRV